MIGECEKKDSWVKWTVLLLLLIILVLAIITVIILLQRKNRGGNIVETTVLEERVGDGVGLIIDPNVENDQLTEKRNTAEQDVAISGQETMTIPANKKGITVDFYNPKENEGRYYLTFEFRICNNSEQGYEVLYTSGLVEPGKHVNQITLSRGLKKGVYEAVIHVQPYRMNEEKTPTNNADMETELIVK